MKRNHEQRSTLMMLAVLLIAGVPALADGGARSPRANDADDAVDLASVTVHGGGLDLAPGVPYERAILTVSGMGRTFSLEFDAYTRPAAGPFDAAGELLPDGDYAWELQLVPDERTARGLRRSAMANGGEPRRPWLPKTGTFAVRGGAFANPELREAGAREPEPEGIAARQLSGRLPGGEKNLAGRAAAVDSDEAAASGAGEASLLESGGAAAARAVSVPSTQTGPDSDRQALELGASTERALVMIPRAHESVLPNPIPRSDGSNGRPRSDR